MMKADKARPTGSWSIATTVRAPGFMVDFFVQHYLRIGCQEINVFFDDPGLADINDQLRNDPRVKIHLCDADYWAGQCVAYPRESALRASHVEGRQYANYMKVQRETECEWVLNIDVDEIVYPRASVDSILRAIPDNIFMIGLKPFEAVYEDLPEEEGVFETQYFKSLIRNHSKSISMLYEESLIPHKYGFWGHNVGKGFFRTSEPLRSLSCHFPKPVNRNLIEKFYTDRMDLLHFESMSFPLFLEKRLRRITRKTYARGISELTQNRLDLFARIYEEGGEPAALDLYSRMNVFSGERLKLALESGFVVQRLIDSCYHKPELKEEMHSFHNHVLVYDNETCFLKAVVPGSSYENQEIIRIHGEPQQSGLAYLYFEQDRETRYIFSDEKGRLVAYSKPQGQMFSLTRLSDSKFALSYEGSYLTVKPNGDVTVSAPAAKAWEHLSIVGGGQ